MSNNKFNNTMLYSHNAIFIEELYQKYLKNPAEVTSEWAEFFSEIQSSYNLPTWHKYKNKIIIENEINNKDLNKDLSLKSNKEQNLSSYLLYRKLGHMMANIDPLGIDKPKENNILGLDRDDNLHNIYSNTIGVEFEHIYDQEEQKWLYEKFESTQLMNFSEEDKLKFLKDVIEVEGFEQYLHKKFAGAKRFSVEGGDNSILAMMNVIEESSKFGVEEVVIGMAHRGRLNSLTKVLGKPYEAIFAEFMGKPHFPEDLGVSGDVKYHMGYSNDINTKYGKKIHLSLTPNPSHLESVNPVLAGRVRAKQDLINDNDRSKVLGILVHGDAAFCGQGVVAESLVMGSISPYNIGGIFHIVVNNQVGFTANPRDGHPLSRYSTDFSKIISAPIIHVNGDDLEAVVRASIFASEYRAKFKKDIILEIFCYRKYGHNEGDEPKYTQPLMYSIIKDKETPALLYAKMINKLDFYTEYHEKFKSILDNLYNKAIDYIPAVDFLNGVWKGYSREINEFNDNVKSGFSQSKLKDFLRKLCDLPENINVNLKVKKLLEARLESIDNEKDIDWATAEYLAFASLLYEGYPIRITGQDAGRGTFSHRHSVIHDQQTDIKYIPLNNISETQAYFEVADSNLSEFGVLGFEFGYSMSSPKTLTIWEAQFGDFANGAQIIIDQYISSSESKWLRLSGLVMLLPHGYEGQGPEHSSARLERFLQLSAENNMVIAYPTTPSSIFHLLRRQMVTNLRKPLVIMSPKSVLRNKLAVSKLNELSEGTNFKEVISEIDSLDNDNVRKVILCSGKIYYDILESRIERNINDIAIIRIEQLYPFPLKQVEHELKKYKNAKIIWAQEEPQNMGAWEYIYSRCATKSSILSNLSYVGRPERASPAVGYLNIHQKEQKEIIDKLLGE